jgi:hypothetical protein
LLRQGSLVSIIEQEASSITRLKIVALEASSKNRNRKSKKVFLTSYYHLQ